MAEDLGLISDETVLGGRYRLRSRLGHGGMAVVWLGFDERLQRPIAVKILSDTLAGDGVYLQRFRREARVAAGLQHPNLVPIYDFGAGSRPYLVMEYVDGGDLGARLRTADAPEPEPLAEQLLGALRHIHAAGVIHRDIKPNNVLVDHYGEARLTDFGIAQPADAASLTMTGQVIGTETYLAPEVLAGEPATVRSDLYALGVVLSQAAQDGAGAGLWALIERLRSDDPGARPRDAGQALAVLERGPAGGPVTQPFEIDAAEPATAEFAARPFEPTVGSGARRPNRWWPVAAIAAVVAAVAAVAIASGGGDGAKSTPANADETPKAHKPPPETTSTATTPSTPTTTTETAAPAPLQPAEGDGVALNNQGYSMIGDGDYAGAIPVLQQAVDALEGSGDELTYNYALFNLAHAMRLAGRPQEAIPLLEQRLGYPDQTGTVQAELDAARQAAGRGGDE
jgi:serine/threonine protein kinase